MDRVDELKMLAHELAEYANGSVRILRSKGIENEEKIRMANLHITLSRRVGYLGTIVSELSGITTIDIKGKEWDMWRVALKAPFDGLADSAIGVCVQATNRAIGKLLDDIRKSIRDKEGNLIKKLQMDSTEPPKAFIAHEGETKSLNKLKKFLEALGIKYFIAEEEASDGRSIERQVDWSQAQGDFVIILATKGKAINKKTDKPYMGLNVADELGRARATFKNKIILLLEKGVEPHTNISEIIHERFTIQSMDETFIKIARELTNWGFITSRATSEHSSEDDEAPVRRLV